jgi:hypothetical protein
MKNGWIGLKRSKANSRNVPITLHPLTENLSDDAEAKVCDLSRPRGLNRLINTLPLCLGLSLSARVRKFTFRWAYRRANAF